MSYKRMIAMFMGAIIVFACTAMMASTNVMGIAEKQTINFTAPTIVGGTVLPAGEYSVTHEMSGQTHVMIFKKMTGKEKVEAKTNCNLVPLKDKAPQTSQRYTVNANNERVLQEITFQGDKATHVLAQ